MNLCFNLLRYLKALLFSALLLFYFTAAQVFEPRKNQLHGIQPLQHRLIKLSETSTENDNPILASSTLPSIFLPQTSTSTSHLMLSSSEKQKAKWRKIGPLIDSRGSPFQRLRLIKQNHPSMPLPIIISRSLASENSHEKIYVPTAKRITDFDLSRSPTTEFSKNIRPATDSLSIQHYKPIFQTPLNNKLQNENKNNFRRYRQRLHLNGPVLASSQEINEKKKQNENLINDQIFNKKHEQQNERHVLLPSDLENYLLPFSEFSHHNENFNKNNRALRPDVHFKLVPNKIGYRPRLRIRRPGDQLPTLSNNVNREHSYIPQLRQENQSYRQKILAQSSFNDHNLHPFHRKAFIIEDHQPARNLGTKVSQIAPLAPLKEESLSETESLLIPSSTLPPSTTLPSPPPSPSPPSSSPLPSPTYFQPIENGENVGSIGEQPPQPSVKILPLPTINTINKDKTIKFSPKNKASDVREAPIEPTVNTVPPSILAELATLSTSTEVPFIIPQNSGLRTVAPPKEFQNSGGFGSSHGSSFNNFGSGSGSFGPRSNRFGLGSNNFDNRGFGSSNKASHLFSNFPSSTQSETPKDEDLYTGESALSRNRKGPTGDGYGPLILNGAAIPPVAPEAVSYGGAAAGVPIDLQDIQRLTEIDPEKENQATTIKPSALLSILNKADEGFNQVINHFEQGTPIEAAAIDVLEVALGSQKLDSQAKLLSHVDRTIGLDNLQRLQRWANTGGALDLFKEQLAKFAQNYKPPPGIKPITIPPQFEYLFQSKSG